MPQAQLYWYDSKTQKEGRSRLVNFMTPVKVTRYEAWLAACWGRIVELRDICDKRGAPINGWSWSEPATDLGQITWCFDHADAPAFTLTIDRLGGGLGR